MAHEPLTPRDLAGIQTAVWNHPTGVSYRNKLTQIAECCQNMSGHRSGVVRLWMYDLYSKSIEEDHRKRGIGEFADENKVETPVVPVTVKTEPKKPKKVASRRTAKPVEQTPVGVSLPHYARVRQNTASTRSIIAEIDAVLDENHKNPFKYPVITARTVEKVVSEQSSVSIQRRKRRKNAELLLLLAA